MIAVSEGYAVIHGLPEGTGYTTISEWRTRVHPDDLAPFDELREQLFGSRQCEFTFDYRLVRADGGIRWIESRGRIFIRRRWAAPTVYWHQHRRYRTQAD